MLMFTGRRRVLAFGILAASQTCLEFASALTPSDPLSAANITSSTLNSTNLTSTIPDSAVNASSAVASTLSASNISFTPTATHSIPLSSTVPSNTSSTVSESFTPGSTASGTGPGGIAVQPTPNPAETHPFTPFPSPTQESIPGMLSVFCCCIPHSLLLFGE